MKRRSGETLTEFLTAATVFGVIMAGLFEFLANQTALLAEIKNRDELMYYAQHYRNTGTMESGVSYNMSSGNKTLKVALLRDDRSERASMIFTLKP